MKQYTEYQSRTRAILRDLYDLHPDSRRIQSATVDHYRRLNEDGWVAFTGPRNVMITNDGLCALSDAL